MRVRRPERVVILSDFSTVQGGASKLALLHARLLVKRGVPVSYIAGDAGVAAPHGVEMTALGGQRLLEANWLDAAVGGLWNTTVARRLEAWIKAHDTAATIYHVHGYHQTLSPSVLAPLKHVSKRVALHAHDYFLECPNGAFFDFRAGETCNRRGLSRACVMCNCDKRSYAHKVWRIARQILQNRARARLRQDATTLLIHAAMEKRLFPDGAPGPVRTVINPADPILPSPIRAETNSDVIFIGDMHAYKGVYLLAEAGRRAGISIRFVGDGRHRSRLEERYPEHRYEGWQSKPGLSKIMAEARCLVCPTLGPEPYGLAPVEAVLSGVPVVLTDSMLMSSAVMREGFGACFKASDCDALAALLTELTRTDDTISQMSCAARKSAAGFALSPEDWCSALCDIYLEMLN